MQSWICYKCSGYNVFETMLFRINKLACIMDAHENLRGLEDTRGWCEDCDEYLQLIKQMRLCSLRYNCGGGCVGAMATDRVVRLVFIFHFQLMVVR